MTINEQIELEQELYALSCGQHSYQTQEQAEVRIAEIEKQLHGKAKLWLTGPPFGGWKQ